MVAATLSEADSVIRNQRTVVTSCIWLSLTAWPDFSPCDICADPSSGKLTHPVSRATRLVGTSEMKRRNEYFILPFLLSVSMWRASDPFEFLLFFFPVLQAGSRCSI